MTIRFNFLNLSLVLISSLICLVVFELALQFSNYSPFKLSSDFTWNHWRRSSEVESNAVRSSYFKYSIFDKDTGFIDRQLKFEYKNRNHEIMFLGDSTGISDPYVNALKSNFSYLGDHFSKKVLFAATPGWDTTNQLQFLKMYLSAPNKLNAIILLLNPNDLEKTPVIIKGKEGSWHAFYVPKHLNYYPLSTLNHSKISQLIFMTLLQISRPISNMEDTNKVVRSLTQIKYLCKTNDVFLLIAYFPPLISNVRSVALFEKKMQSILNKVQLNENTVSLFKISKEKNMTNFQFEKGDRYHFNQTAGNLLAKEISKRIRQRFPQN